ncbi:MAG: shikimate kinase [Planctomycetota bacterium]|jgi:XRE family aerobic/anaerobic benzoate catabolism transcriptional regulator|nr:shikimate kinase [Planctomycetota bacterium]
METEMSNSLLQNIGKRVRRQRSERKLRISDLAKLSRLSTRYISEVERGKGNISICKLNEIAIALNVPLRSLIPVTKKPNPRQEMDALLEECTEQSLQRVLSLASIVLGKKRPKAIALLGIRGAGKTTVGTALASTLGIPFVELMSRIETLAGIPQAAIFSFHGEQYYRRLELQALTELLSSSEPCVVALPGGIVTHGEAFELVKESCYSIWLSAAPEEYLQRVYAQGDTRPMEGFSNAMVELRRLVDSRTPLYRQADLTQNTSGQSVKAMVASLCKSIDARNTPSPIPA